MARMRRGRALLFVVIAALLALQAAAASGTSRASFLVSLSGSVGKQWTYSATATTLQGCSVKTTGGGLRTISFRSADNSVVRASRGANGRAKFSGGVGSLTDTTPHRLTCKPLMRVRSHRTFLLVSPRLHHVGFKAAKGLVPVEFFNTCPGEPTAVRGVAGGLDLATAKLSEADLFDRNVGGITLQGSSEVTTQTLSGSAKVVQRVNWRLTLRRLGS
jgi:hypothetical protein